MKIVQVPRKRQRFVTNSSHIKKYSENVISSVQLLKYSDSVDYGVRLRNKRTAITVVSKETDEGPENELQYKFLKFAIPLLKKPKKLSIHLICKSTKDKTIKNAVEDEVKRKDDDKNNFKATNKEKNIMDNKAKHLSKKQSEKKIPNGEHDPYKKGQSSGAAPTGKFNDEAGDRLVERQKNKNNRDYCDYNSLQRKMCEIIEDNKNTKESKHRQKQRRDEDNSMAGSRWVTKHRSGKNKGRGRRRSSNDDANNEGDGAATSGTGGGSNGGGGNKDDKDKDKEDKDEDKKDEDEKDEDKKDDEVEEKMDGTTSVSGTNIAVTPGSSKRKFPTCSIACGGNRSVSSGKSLTGIPAYASVSFERGKPIPPGCSYQCTMMPERTPSRKSFIETGEIHRCSVSCSGMYHPNPSASHSSCSSRKKTFPITVPPREPSLKPEVSKVSIGVGAGDEETIEVELKAEGDEKDEEEKEAKELKVTFKDGERPSEVSIKESLEPYESVAKIITEEEEEEEHETEEGVEVKAEKKEVEVEEGKEGEEREAEAAKSKDTLEEVAEETAEEAAEEEAEEAESVTVAPEKSVSILIEKPESVITAAEATTVASATDESPAVESLAKEAPSVAVSEGEILAASAEAAPVEALSLIESAAEASAVIVQPPAPSNVASAVKEPPPVPSLAESAADEPTPVLAPEVSAVSVPPTTPPAEELAVIPSAGTSAEALKETTVTEEPLEVPAEVPSGEGIAPPSSSVVPSAVAAPYAPSVAEVGEGEPPPPTISVSAAPLVPSEVAEKALIKAALEEVAPTPAEATPVADYISTGLPVTAGGVVLTVGGKPVLAEGLPVTAGGMPVTVEGVPVLIGGLPLTAGGVPVTVGGVPVTAGGVPVVAGVLDVEEFKEQGEAVTEESEPAREESGQVTAESKLEAKVIAKEEEDPDRIPFDRAKYAARIYDDENKNCACQKPHDKVSSVLKKNFDGEVICFSRPQCLLIQGCVSIHDVNGRMKIDISNCNQPLDGVKTCRNDPCRNLPSVQPVTVANVELPGGLPPQDSKPPGEVLCIHHPLRLLVNGCCNAHKEPFGYPQTVLPFQTTNIFPSSASKTTLGNSAYKVFWSSSQIISRTDMVDLNINIIDECDSRYIIQRVNGTTHLNDIIDSQSNTSDDAKACGHTQTSKAAMILGLTNTELSPANSQEINSRHYNATQDYNVVRDINFSFFNQMNHVSTQYVKSKKYICEHAAECPMVPKCFKYDTEAFRVNSFEELLCGHEPSCLQVPICSIPTYWNTNDKNTAACQCRRRIGSPCRVI